MSSDDTGHKLVPQTTGTNIERQQMTAAGRAANRAAAEYLFADYRQRRAESTLRTQRAALVLWIEYLAEVGAVSELLTEAQAWALMNLNDEELEELAEYAAVRQTSLPITAPPTASRCPPPGRVSPGAWSKGLSSGCSTKGTV